MELTKHNNFARGDMIMRLFDFKNKKQWTSEVAEYASLLLDTRVKRHLKRQKPDCYSDDFSWLPVEDGDALFSELFANYYTHIRCFHGCRPLDISSYLNHGIRTLEPSMMDEAFLKIFSDVPEEQLRAALQAKNTEDRRQLDGGKVFVALEYEELVEYCGHYLIQGSEYIMALAAAITKHHSPEDYRLRLRKIGIPTVFEAHVPTSNFGYRVTLPQNSVPR